MSVYEYSQLQFLNNTDSNATAVLKSERTDFELNENHSWQTQVTRFQIDSDNIPCYVMQPNVTDYANLWNIEGHHMCMISDNTPPTQDTMNISIGFEDFTNNRASYANLQWISSDLLSPKPLNNSRQSCLNNKYYYAYSSQHISVLLLIELNRLFLSLFTPATKLNGQDFFELIRNGDSFSLLLNNRNGYVDDIGLNNFRIIANQAFFDIFAFSKTKHETLTDAFCLTYDVNQLSNVTLNDSAYYGIATQYLSSFIFPWQNLCIITDMPVKALMTNSNVSELVNDKFIILTDYSFASIDNVDAFYNRIIFAMQGNSNRLIDFKSSNKINKFECRFMLSSYDGYMIPVTLGPNRFCSLLLQFIGTPL